MATHREMYPEQYTHPLVGKRVRVRCQDEVRGTVERVVESRFGQLAILCEYGKDCAWLVADCEVEVTCSHYGCDACAVQTEQRRTSRMPATGFYPVCAQHTAQ